MRSLEIGRNVWRFRGTTIMASSARRGPGNSSRTTKIDVSYGSNARTGAIAGGCACERRNIAAIVLEAIVRVRWAGIPGERRLYGSGQLGHGPGRRRAFWLPVAVGAGDVERDGDSAADAERAAWNRHRARLGAGLPRALSAGSKYLALGAVRGGDCGVRFGGSSRRGHRTEPAVSHPAASGRAVNNR